MNTRIKKLRRELDMTQEKFGAEIGVKGNTVAQWESGRNDPPDSAIVSICREFHANEHWLRTGEGEMFNRTSRSEEIVQFAVQAADSGEDDFKRRFLLALARIPEDRWAEIEAFTLQLAEKDKKADQD